MYEVMFYDMLKGVFFESLFSTLFSNKLWKKTNLQKKKNNNNNNNISRTK